MKILLAALLIGTAPLNATVNQQVMSSGPVVSSTSSSGIASSLYSQGAYVIDNVTDQVLLDKNSDDTIYPASLTKLMSALVFAENVSDWSDTITVTAEMLAGLSGAGASVVGYQTGAEPDMNSLLYGMLLPSGADAANAAAFYVAGSVEAFVEMMNDKAKNLGMTNTNFVNPNGLHDDEHYSSCRDLALLMSAAIENDMIKTALQTYEYTDNLGITMESTWYDAMVKGDYAIPGLMGAKTGYTGQAGRCLAGFGEINGMSIISVTVLGESDEVSSPHLADAATIYTWLNDEYSRKTVLESGELVKTVTLCHMFGEEEAYVYASRDIDRDVPNDATVTLTCDLPSAVYVYAYEQELSGTAYVAADGKTVAETSVSLTVKGESNIIAWLLLKLRSFFF